MGRIADAGGIEPVAMNLAQLLLNGTLGLRSYNEGHHEVVLIFSDRDDADAALDALEDMAGGDGEVADHKLPKDWLAPLIHSMMATGNFGKMARDAMDQANRLGRKSDATLYRNMLDQISDYYAQMDRDGGNITIRL